MHSLTILVARGLIIVPVLVVLYLLWTLDKKERRRLALLLVVGGALSLILAKIGAHFYSDPRPYYKDHITPYFYATHYNGFPSDHTLLASFLGFSVMVYWRRVGWALLALAAVIGWARVASGVHHLVDIIGAFVFTATATYLAIWALRRGHKPQHHTKTPANS